MTAMPPSPALLALPLTAEGYAQANEAFRQCWSADRAEVLDFLNRHLPADPAEVMRVLGFGVGDGSFDQHIIAALRSAFPAATMSYTAVEPNEAQLARFIAQIDQAPPPGVQVEFHALRAEDYQIDTPQDLIHYIHSLYHMPGSEEQLLRAAIAGLKPGGRLLIALSSERGGIYEIMGRFWNRIDYSFFTSGLFGQESLQATLDRIGRTYSFERYPAVAIDVSDCFDPSSERGRHLLNFLLQAAVDQAPADLRAEILAALDDLARTENGRRLLPHPSGVFVVS